MRVVFGQDSKLTFDDQCREAAKVGFKGFDLIGQQDWPTLKKHGLVPTMAGAGPVTFQDGLIHKEAHEKLEPALREHIDMCASHGVTNIISVGGQRRAMGESEGADNAVAFLNRVKSHLEDKNVTLCIENMNHKYTDANFGRVDQIFAHPQWGFDVCKRVNSPQREGALRHLPRAGDGRRPGGEHPREFSMDRPLPHGRRPGADRHRAARRKSTTGSWHRRSPISGSPGISATSSVRRPVTIRSTASAKRSRSSTLTAVSLRLPAPAHPACRWPSASSTS